MLAYQVPKRHIHRLIEAEQNRANVAAARPGHLVQNTFGHLSLKPAPEGSCEVIFEERDFGQWIEQIGKEAESGPSFGIE